MTSEAAGAPVGPMPLPSPRRGRRSRAFALVRLFDLRVKARLGAQLAKAFGVAATLGYAVALPFAARGDAGDSSDLVVLRALGWLFWITAGGTALSAAGPADGPDDRALRELASLHGHTRFAMSVAESAAVARRVLWTTGVPAGMLALLSLGFARSLPLLGARLMLLGGVLGAVALLAGVLAALVHAARHTSRSHARSVLLGLVLLPELARWVFPHAPSVPALFDLVLDGLARLGGSVP